MKRINQILFSSIIFIVFLVGLIFYQIYKPENLGCATPDRPKEFYGNSNLTENIIEGKNLFNSNCAACHKRYGTSTGPALAEIDSLVFIKWLTNKENKIDSSKVELNGIDYHKMVFSKTLDENQIAGLIEFCKN
jgi:hypothetical protein